MLAGWLGLRAEQSRKAGQKEQRKQADDILAGATKIIVKLQNQMNIDTQKQVLSVFETGADRGDKTSMRNLGLSLRQRFWRGAGLRQGARMVREGRRQGRRERHERLGNLYANGQGVAQDYAKAREWYEKAADKGDAGAMVSLGLLYANGQGVPQDYAKARENYVKAHEWYEKAAAQGRRERHGQPRCALRQRSGRGAGLRQGARVVREGRRQGRRERHGNLGALYANGQGVAQDYAKAREWYEKAADKGDASAMTNLGCALRQRSGRGAGLRQGARVVREGR